MRHILTALAVLFSAALSAQTVPDTLTINYTLPTLTTSGLPLTGVNALTEIRIFIDTAPIPDTASTPTVTVTPSQTTVSRTIQVANGQTVYTRIRACNKPGATTDCSDLTQAVTKVISLPTTPALPTNVTIQLQIG